MTATKLMGILVLIMPLMACSQSTDNQNQSSEPEGWKSLSGDNFSIKYPDNWEASESGQMGTSFILLSPRSSEQDQFNENVNLTIQDLSGLNLDLDQYVEISIEQIETMITDGVVLESTRETTEAVSFHKMLFTGKQGIFNLKFEQYYWIIGEEAYVLTLTCEESQFDAYQDTGEKILNSFKFGSD